MSAEVFLDSNIVIYTLDKRDERRELALSLVAAGGTISTQVLSETANVARRKLLLEYPAIRTILQGIAAHCRVEPVTLQTVVGALWLGERYGFSYYDSLVISAAQLAGCSVLYSEDLQNGQVIDKSLTIVNPFGEAAR